MSKRILRDPLENPPNAPEARQSDLPAADRRHAGVEMARVLGTVPFRMALDSSGAGIAHWKHDPLHDVVEPMSHHVIMAYNGSVQRMERRSGRSVAIGTFRPGVVIIIPEGSSSRWDIPKPVDVVQLYLPHATLKRVADQADTATPIDLLERTAHPDPVTSRLLLSAADVAGGQSRPWIRCSGSNSQTSWPRVCWLRTAARQPRSSRSGAGWRRRRCFARSSACARTAMRMSLSRRSLRMPACRASTSAVPSRIAPGFHLMPGCASTGSSRP